MLEWTLTWLEVPRRASFPELRRFATALRRGSRLPGLLHCQAYRGVEATEALLVLGAWAEEAALRGGTAFAARELAAARCTGLAPERCETFALAQTYDFRFLPRKPAAMLLRAARGGGAGSEAERELALRAMAEPGSLRATGARGAQRQLSLCRLEFDLEDGLWHFLQSPLRSEWSELARARGQREVWALNLPRFGFAAAELPPGRTGGVGERETAGSLGLELRVHSPGEAELLLEGRMDEHGAGRLKTVVEALVRDGCRRLVLDLRGLESRTSTASAALLAVVRQVKSEGGQVELVECDNRFNRAARGINLLRSIEQMRKERADPERF